MIKDLRASSPTPSRSHSRSHVVLAAALLMSAVALAFVAWGGPGATDADERAEQIAAGLRCPVCADLSAADSPAPIARQMRLQIRRQVDRGVPAAQIRERFVEAYGPSVLLSPPDRGWGRLAHIAPLAVVAVALVSGAAVVARGLRRRPAEQVDLGGSGVAGDLPPGELPPLSPVDREVVQRALADLIRGPE